MRAKLLELIKTKGQQAVSLEALFLHFGEEPPTKEEMVSLVESRKAVEFKSQPRVEDTQQLYWRKMSESKVFAVKKQYIELINGTSRDYLIKRAIEDLYLVENA